jgi:hypothetical protein
MTPSKIKELLAGYRFDTSCEAILQAQIEKVFQDSGAPYQREVRLSARDRIDFMLDGIGVEVKIKGQAKEIFRQCQRYCTYDQITAIVLVTGRSMGFPETIEGKPCYYHNLGRNWL